MAFADHISGSTGLMWYCRISGIPLLLHNADTLPAAWLTGSDVVIDGETYTPSKTLTMRDGMTVEQKLAPKQGIASSSGQTIKFLLDDTWLGLVTTSLQRNGSYSGPCGFEGLEVDDTTLDSDDISGWPATNTLYVGTETMASASRTGTDFTVVRARYGSQALPILASGDSLLQLGAYGAVVADHPTVWLGRTLQLWCSTGSWQSDGTFSPNGATIESGEDQRVYQGVISGLEIDRDTQHVTIKLQPLDSLLDRQVGSRLPELRLGPGSTTASQLIGHDASNNKVRGLVTVDGEQAVLSSALYGLSSVLDDGASSLSDIARGISRAMMYDLDDQSPSWWGAGDVISIAITTDSDGVASMAFNMSLTAAAVGIMTMILNPHADTVWRSLGIEGQVWVTSPVAIGANDESWTVEADRSLPQSYLADNDVAGARIWWTSSQGPDYDGATDWRTRTNGTIYAHVRIGDEIVEVGEATEVTTYGETRSYATVRQRARLGTLRQEHYAEVGDDAPVGVQGIGLPGPYTADAWLYLLCGGSGVYGHQDYAIDRGWRGSGAYIPIDLVDVDSFAGLRADRRWISDNLGVFKSERLREVIQGGLIGQAYAIAAGADQIRAVDVIPPTVSDAGAAVMALDHSNTRTIAWTGIGLDLSEKRIVNRLEISSGIDNATGEYTQQHPASHAWSIGTWGPSEPLRMLLRSLSASAVSDTFALKIAEALLAAFGTPYALIEVEISDPLCWSAIELGSIVTLTNELVPAVSNGISFVTVGRGITALPARVMALRRDYPRDSATGTQPRGRVTLVIANIDGTQTAHWAPSAKCKTLLVSATILELENNEYSADGESRDVTHFDGSAAHYVRLRTYDGGTSELRGVTAVGVNSITITPATTLTAPFLVEFPTYSDATMATAQRPFAFQADDDHKLDKSSGSDPPRKYR